jgi:hypothetical protein
VIEIIKIAFDAAMIVIFSAMYLHFLKAKRIVMEERLI